MTILGEIDSVSREINRIFPSMHNTAAVVKQVNIVLIIWEIEVVTLNVFCLIVGKQSYRILANNSGIGECDKKDGVKQWLHSCNDFAASQNSNLWV